MKYVFIGTAVLSLLVTGYSFACDEEAASNEETASHAEISLKEKVLNDPESVKAGEKTFNSLCVYCHGAGGSGGKAKKLAGRNLEVDYMFKTITEGKKRGSLNMPPWKRLAEEKRWTLVAYVRSLSEPSK